MQNPQVFPESEYSGTVFDENLDRGNNEGYFPSVKAYKDAVLKQSPTDTPLQNLPEYVYGCKSYGMDKFTAQEIAEDSVQDLYEDAIDDVTRESLILLQDALDAFYEANKHVQSHESDWKIKISLDWSNEQAIVPKSKETQP